MQTNSRRNFPRNQCEAPIQYLYMQPDRYYNSRTYNFSEGGLYFKSLQPLELNSQINIIMPNYSPDAQGPEAYQSYLAVIRWCQKLPTASVCRIDGSICLCPDCFHRLDEMPEGDVKSGIKRFLDGNVL